MTKRYLLVLAFKAGFTKLQLRTSNEGSLKGDFIFYGYRIRAFTADSVRNHRGLDSR